MTYPAFSFRDLVEAEDPELIATILDIHEERTNNRHG